MAEKAEKAKPVVNRDDDHALVAREVGPLTDRLHAGSGDQTAAVYPHENRQFFVVVLGGRPDVQVEAILLILGVWFGRHLLKHSLDRSGAKAGGIAGAPPAAWLLRRPEATLADRRRGVGNTAEDLDAFIAAALQETLLHPDQTILEIRHKILLQSIY
jgi:hypothetical protein